MSGARKYSLRLARRAVANKFGWESHRRNHIKQINWQESNMWQETLLFENDFNQPRKIKEVPGTYLYTKCLLNYYY